MFGLLDYRAAKLFFILFVIPTFILRVILIFGVPWISYEFTKDFIYGESWSSVGQILIFLGFFIIATLIAELINIFLYEKVFKFIFDLLVDIIPAEGRTEEQAKLVAYSGESARDLINLNKKKWSEIDYSDIEKIVRHKSIFFRHRAKERLNLIRNYCEEHYPEATGESNINLTKLEEKFKELDCHVNIFETILGNKQYRNLVYQFLFLIYFANKLNSDGLFTIIFLTLALAGAFFGSKKFQIEFGKFTKKIKKYIPKKFETKKKEDAEEKKSFNWFVGIIIFIAIINIIEFILGK